LDSLSGVNRAFYYRRRWGLLDAAAIGPSAICDALG
jgi:hypothetical protein